MNILILRFRSTLRVMLRSSCAVDFLGWPGLGLSLTLPVLANLSLSLEIVVLWTPNAPATWSTSVPACNIPIAWFLRSLLSLGMTRLDHEHLVHKGNHWFTQQKQHSNLLNLWQYQLFKSVLTFHGWLIADMFGLEWWGSKQWTSSLFWQNVKCGFWLLALRGLLHRIGNILSHENLITNSWILT